MYAIGTYFLGAPKQINKKDNSLSVEIRSVKLVFMIYIIYYYY